VEDPFPTGRTRRVGSGKAPEPVEDPFPSGKAPEPVEDPFPTGRTRRVASGKAPEPVEDPFPTGRTRRVASGKAPEPVEDPFPTGRTPSPGRDVEADPAVDTQMTTVVRRRTEPDPDDPVDEPGPPPAEGGRAGRNLVAAVGVGVALAGAIVASLTFRKEAFVALTCAAIVLGVWELAGALAVKRLNIPVLPLAVGSVGILVSAYVAGREGLVVAFALTAFGALLWRVIDGVDGAARDIAASVFAAAYVPLLAGFAMLMLGAQDGAARVAVFIVVTVASDTGGYTAGVLFGRRPMAPTVSPKKSWEGFAGSVLTSMAAGVTAVLLLLHGPWWVGLAVGAAAAVTATLGDLSESLLKRDLGIKDMGTLLPGHGGMMDRLDSLLPTAPAVYLLLALFVTPH
jgi:CDP-diglyceride synthetase